MILEKDLMELIRKTAKEVGVKEDLIPSFEKFMIDVYRAYYEPIIKDIKEMDAKQGLYYIAWRLAVTEYMTSRLAEVLPEILPTQRDFYKIVRAVAPIYH